MTILKKKRKDPQRELCPACARRMFLYNQRRKTWRCSFGDCLYESATLEPTIYANTNFEQILDWLDPGNKKSISLVGNIRATMRDWAMKRVARGVTGHQLRQITGSLGSIDNNAPIFTLKKRLVLVSLFAIIASES